jgi:hypothetical protein
MPVGLYLQLPLHSTLHGLTAFTLVHFATNSNNPPIPHYTASSLSLIIYCLFGIPYTLHVTLKILCAKL